MSVGADPLTANRYTYVNGDPVNLIDPTGHCARNPDDRSVYNTCIHNASSAAAYYPPNPTPVPSGFNFARCCDVRCFESPAPTPAQDAGCGFWGCIGKTLVGWFADAISSVAKAPTVAAGWAGCVFKGSQVYRCNKNAERDSARIDEFTNAATGCGDSPAPDPNRCAAIGWINVSIAILSAIDLGVEALDLELSRLPALLRPRGAPDTVPAPRAPGIVRPSAPHVPNVATEAGPSLGRPAFSGAGPGAASINDPAFANVLSESAARRASFRTYNVPTSAANNWA